jgi:hypothetical protein
MLALSNLAALLVASVALAVGATPSSQPISEAGNTCCVYPGWDMDNGNYATVPNITELACLRECRDSEFYPLDDEFCSSHPSRLQVHPASLAPTFPSARTEGPAKRAT